MENFAISTHNFEKAKNDLQKFSKETPSNLALPVVEIDGGFLGLGDHKVTGYELNDITEKIQKNLMNINKMNIRLIREFGSVYNVFEFLDKEYMFGIKNAIIEADKANEDVKKAQIDINNTIEIQKKTVDSLQKFKTKLEHIKHISDVDELWKTNQRLEDEMKSINRSLKKYVQETNKTLQTLNQFIIKLEKSKHILDIDKLWEMYQRLEDSYDDLDDEVGSIKDNFEEYTQKVDKEMSELMIFKANLEKNQHIYEIDKMWDKLDSMVDTQTSQMATMNQTISENSQNIKQINEKIGICAHIEDIDTIWEQNQVLLNQIRNLKISIGVILLVVILQFVLFVGVF